MEQDKQILSNHRAWESPSWTDPKSRSGSIEFPGEALLELQLGLELLPEVVSPCLFILGVGSNCRSHWVRFGAKVKVIG